MEDLKKIQEFFSKPLEEVTKSQMLKKAKKGSYPATLVAIENGKVVAQEKVNTPQEAPASHSVMSKKYPNANIRLEDSTGKILEENAFVEAFKFEKALKGMGYDVKVKYLDDFGKDVFEIYFNNPADADESIFYDAKKLGYDNVRVFANPQESLDEAYIVTYAKNKGERPASVAYKLRGSALAFMRDLEKDGYTTMLTQRPVDGVDEAVEEYNSGIYFNPDKSSPRPKIKDGAKSGIEKVKDILKKIVKERVTESSTSEERRIAKRAIRSIAKYRGVSEDEARNDLIRAAKELGSLEKAVREMFETIELGKNLNEELCEKGKRYIKARQAAGEKSSAYLSGRAVRVCKGQIEWPKKGKKK